MVNAEINDGQHSLNFAIDDVEEPKPSSLEAAFDYIEGIFRDFSELPEIHESVLDEIVDDRISKLQSLAQIDKGTYNRIAPIAAENTRFLYSGAWATSWARALATRPRLESSLIVTVTCGVLPLIGVVAFGEHHVRIGNLSNLFASLFALLVFSIFLWAVMRLLRFLTKGRFIGIRNTFISVGIGWLAAFSATKGDKVSALVLRYSGGRSAFKHRSFIVKLYSLSRAIHWPAVVHNALWVIATFMAFRVLCIAFKFIVKNMMLARVTKSSSAVMYSSAVQDRLLEIAYILNHYLIAKDKGEIASVPYSVQAGVVDMIAEVARMIEGPWVRSLRTGSRSTDNRTAQVGQNIAHTILEWQSRAVFGGRHLGDLRDDCIHAYVKSLDGEWDLIANGDSAPRRSRVTRVKGMARRLIAIFLPGFLAYVIIRVMPISLSSYKPFAILTAVLLTSVQIIALIDPDITERVNTVLNVVTAVRRAPKS